MVGLGGGGGLALFMTVCDMAMDIKAVLEACSSSCDA